MFFAGVTTVWGVWVIWLSIIAPGSGEVIRGDGRYSGSYYTAGWFLLLFGVITTLFGAYGLYHHLNYFAAMRAKRRKKLLKKQR
jgi:hypothetical protein